MCEAGMATRTLSYRRRFAFNQEHGKNLSYHSKHGAINESQHIYINTGLRYISSFKNKISILEVGFGTGLNALLTLIDAEKNDLQILYDVVELYPLDNSIIAALNYLSVLGAPEQVAAFRYMHSCEWNVRLTVSDHFQLRKVAGDIRFVELFGPYDVVYFDAFDLSADPALWTVDVFRKIYEVVADGGVLVTYSGRASVRKAMKKAEFGVKRVSGPAGKREIVRCTKS